MVDIFLDGDDSGDIGETTVVFPNSVRKGLHGPPNDTTRSWASDAKRASSCRRARHRRFRRRRLAYSMMGVTSAILVSLPELLLPFIEGTVPPVRVSGWSGSVYTPSARRAPTTENDYFFIIDEINRGEPLQDFRAVHAHWEAINAEVNSLLPRALRAHSHIIGMMNTARTAASPCSTRAAAASRSCLVPTASAPTAMASIIERFKD